MLIADESFIVIQMILMSNMKKTYSGILKLN